MACWRSEFIRPVMEEREGREWGSGLLRGELLHVEARERICNAIVNPMYVLGRNCEVSTCSYQKQGMEEGHHVGATGGAKAHAVTTASLSQLNRIFLVVH